MPLSAGTRIGVFDVVGVLGAGGMGEVYRARDMRLGREVAIKVLPHGMTSDPDRLARFEREARMLATLNHPHIGAIYGLEEGDGIRALVLELVEGPTLADRIAHMPIPLKEALTIARQIADALDAAHEKGIIHRDLKPANIKITPSFGVKVLDFGLAKPAEGGALPDLTHSPTVTALNTGTGVILGTAAYMSPEQARGQAVDKRTDIWAFACVLYEMLTGHSPFHRETLTDTLAAIVDGEPDWSALPASAPASVVGLLHRCLERDPRRRLRDIGDARHDLEDRPEDHRPGGTDRFAGVNRKTRFGWAVALVGAAAVTGALGWTLARRDAGPTTPQLSRAVRLTNTPEWEFGPAISPDGKWVAYVAAAQGRGDIWVKSLQSSSALNITASLPLDVQVRAGQGTLDISPDGSQIAFIARERQPVGQFSTWVIPAPIGGVPRKLLANLTACRWSPDGTRLACILGGGTRGDALFVANADGTDQREVLPVQGGRHIHYPEWSRDGRYVYFIYTYDVNNDEPSEIYRVPVGGGTPEPVVQTLRRAVFPAPLPDAAGLLYAGNSDTVDLGLWWRPETGGDGVSLTTGVGEHMEPRVSADGSRAVATLVETHQALMLVPVRFDRPPDPVPVTDGYSGDLDPSLDPRSGRLVFSSSRSGNRNLWISRADGTGPTPLTTESSIDSRPAFSPDGRQIAFVSDRGGRRGIWTMSAEGGTPRFVGAAAVIGPVTWSPDGGSVFYASPAGDLPLLERMSLADGRTSRFATPGAASAPVWSAATHRLAYIEPVQNASAGTNVLRFMNERGEELFPEFPRQRASINNGFLAWSADGRRVAAVAVVGNASATIWIAEPEGKEPLRKLIDLPLSVRPRGITWTADGSGVIVAFQDSSSDIVMFDLRLP